MGFIISFFKLLWRYIRRTAYFHIKQVHTIIKLFMVTKLFWKSWERTVYSPCRTWASQWEGTGHWDGQEGGGRNPTAMPDMTCCNLNNIFFVFNRCRLHLQPVWKHQRLYTNQWRTWLNTLHWWSSCKCIKKVSCYWWYMKKT